MVAAGERPPLRRALRRARAARARDDAALRHEPAPGREPRASSSRCSRERFATETTADLARPAPRRRRAGLAGATTSPRSPSTSRPRATRDPAAAAAGTTLVSAALLGRRRARPPTAPRRRVLGQHSRRGARARPATPTSGDRAGLLEAGVVARTATRGRRGRAARGRAAPRASVATAISASRSTPVSTPSRLEQVEDVLGRDVAGRARRERAAAEAADRRVEHGRAGLDRRPRVRDAGVARVVEVAADRDGRGSRTRSTSRAHPAAASRRRSCRRGRSRPRRRRAARPARRPRAGSTSPSNGQPNAHADRHGRGPVGAREDPLDRADRLLERGVPVALVEGLRRGERDVDAVERASPRSRS